MRVDGPPRRWRRGRRELRSGCCASLLTAAERRVAQLARQGQVPLTDAPLCDTYTCAEKFESFERINSIRETNGNFDSCNSCKRLVPSRLHELHESKFPFVSRIEFIRSKLSNFSAHVYVVCVVVQARNVTWAVGHCAVILGNYGSEITPQKIR